MLAKIAFAIIACSTAALAQTPPNINGADVTGKFFPIEWNTIMVESTYRIQAPSTTPGKTTIGTGFVLGIPIEDGSKEPTQSRPVLITAEHVFAETAGDIALLDMRTFEGGVWTESQVPIRIRDRGRPLWAHHPVADVAILDLLDLRTQAHLISPLVPTDWLASDSLLKDYQIHPGDEVMCLGFPLNLSSQFGFPILRTARIASYPILPTASSRPLYLDFPVYGGNSGGPAYLAESSARGRMLGPALSHLFLIGLVIEKQYGSPTAQVAVNQVSGEPDGSNLADMHLAILEPSSVIMETINLLPGIVKGHYTTGSQGIK